MSIRGKCKAQLSGAALRAEVDAGAISGESLGRNFALE